MGTVGQYLGQKGPVIKQHDVSDEYRSRFLHSDPTCYAAMRQRWLEEGRDDETFEQWKARIGNGACKCGHPV